VDEQLGHEDARAVLVDPETMTGVVEEPWTGMVREPLSDSDRSRAELAEAVVELRTQAVIFARRVGTAAAVAGGICAVAAVALIVRRAVR
jgi:hypothetical protein